MKTTMELTNEELELINSFRKEKAEKEKSNSLEKEFEKCYNEALYKINSNLDLAKKFLYEAMSTLVMSIQGNIFLQLSKNLIS